jgi:hypothetical protein
MKVKRTLAVVALAAATSVIPLAATAAPAVAATPGGACSITATFEGVSILSAAGLVSTNGRNCTPATALPGLLGFLVSLNVGVPCNLNIPAPLFGADLAASCPSGSAG